MKALAVLALALAGCAAPPLHVPPHTGRVDGWARWTEPPETVQLTWKRVGFFELQRVCGSGYSPLTVGGSGLGGGPMPSMVSAPAARAMPVNACAISTADRSQCTIYTTERVFLQTLGHEVAHCFVENVPGH